MLVLLFLSLTLQAAEPGAVQVRRIPAGELQPQVALDAEGRVHLLTFRGDPSSGELAYRRSADEGESWSEPLVVGSGAVALGQVRGGQLALGRSGWVHVAWNGSSEALPGGPQGEVPLCYSRLAAGDAAFEPQRNVITTRFGLDGGCGIAADGQGHVWIAWHAPGDGPEGEAGRALWVTRSNDDGATFEPERLAWTEPTGACACCGVRAAHADGVLYILYRAAREEIHRGMVLLVSDDAGESFEGHELDEWRVERCPLSTSALAAGPLGVVAAWERAGSIRSALLVPGEPLERERMIRSVVRGNGWGPVRLQAELKHPALAVDAEGRTLVAALADVRWGRDCRLDWRLADAQGSKLAQPAAAVDPVPAWSLVAVFARPSGGFVILY